MQKYTGDSFNEGAQHDPTHRTHHRRQPRPRTQHGAAPGAGRRRHPLHLPEQRQCGAGRRAVALQLDTGNSASFAGFADQVRTTLANWSCERFDILVNNAGAGLHVPLLDVTEAQFDSIVAMHFKAPVFLTTALLPLLNDGGRILNVSSGLTRFSLPGYGVYAAAKGAVEVLTRYQAREFAGRGITVNTLAPGAIETDFGGGAVRDNLELNRMVAGMTALGRVGQPDDIGGAVAALLAEGNGWMTGQRVEVSGGMLL